MVSSETPRRRASVAVECFVPSYIRTVKPNRFAARFHSSRRAFPSHRFPAARPDGFTKSGISPFTRSSNILDGELVCLDAEGQSRFYDLIAIKQCNEDPTYSGKGLAVAGLVCGIVAAIVAVAWIAILVLAGDSNFSRLPKQPATARVRDTRSGGRHVIRQDATAQTFIVTFLTFGGGLTPNTPWHSTKTL